MSEPRIAFATAVLTGVAGDVLLRPSPWGVGFSVWMVVVAGAVLVTLRGGRRRLEPAVAVFLAAAVVFGAFLTLRDSPELRVWNVMGALIALVMALIAGRGLPLAGSDLVRYGSAAVTSALAVLSSPIEAAAAGSRRTGGGTTRLMLRLLVAVLLAVPLLLLFGTLLTSADPVFAHLVRTAFGFDVGTIVSHGVVITVLSWSAAGYGLALLQRRRTDAHGVTTGLPALGLIEIGTPMVALTVLFAAFIGVQAGYLFGGETLVQSSVGLSFAEYARRGFFELVTTSGLMIPVVVGADLLLRENDPRAVRWFRWIARAQIVGVGLIMGSAVERLRIYYHAYGLTVDRLLAAAVMLWIAFTLAWFTLTVLRGRRTRFPLAVVVAGLAVLATLDTVNPEAMVVRVNVQRAVAGSELDVSYLSRLSGDAVPAMVTDAGRLPAGGRRALLSALTERWSRPDRSDWRSWNLGYARARSAVERLPGSSPTAVIAPLRGTTP